MKKLWLDDEIGPSFVLHGVEPEEWMWVHTVQEVTDALEDGGVEAVHLDYNLSRSEGFDRTGMDVLDYILHSLKVKQQLPPKIFIHTHSSVARRGMLEKMKEIERYAQALRAQQKGETSCP